MPEWWDAPARERGLRVIGFDRPGYGNAPAEPNRTLRSVADATAALMDDLGAEKFAVIGVSGGGPYALASAAFLPDRVVAAISAAGSSGFDEAIDGAMMDPEEAELTREQLYLQLHAELPYAAAVATEKWEDRADGSTAIHQQILIERESQKAIVVGKGGKRLKAIGQAARAAIGDHLGRKVHLYLHVKVAPKWGEDRGLYEDIGLDWAD